MKWFFTLFVCFLCSLLGAQNSDCNTAISVCEEEYVENDSPSGTGNIFELAPNSCQTSGEFNSAWYVFTVQESGVLSFTLQPNDNFDDYDWSLYNITDNGCAGINNGNSPEVSCNSYGLLGGSQGPTGISTDMGGSGNSNGPGDLNGPPFNSDVNVVEGQVYALSVMNFSSTLNGYTLDFGQSTASIFDDEDPHIIGVEQNCNADEIELTFSESVISSDLTNDMFVLELNGNQYFPTGVTPASNDFTTQITLEFPVSLEEGSYSLSAGNGAGVEDFCGNPWQVAEDFQISAPFQFGNVVVTSACNGNGGALEYTDTSGGLEPFTIVLNNSAQSDFNFTGLAAGNYTIEVTDDLGCEYSTTATVTDIVVQVNAGEDQSLCEMETDLNASYTGEIFYWLDGDALNFSDEEDPLTSVAVTTPGNYSITAYAETDGCVVYDDVDVTFSYPPQVTISNTDETCHAYCDGTVFIDNANAGIITASLDGVFITGNDILFENVCDGQKELLITFSAECEASYDVFIDSPAQVIASFEADPWVTTVVDTEILLTNTSENADSVHWDLSGYDETSTEDQWTIELPQVIGTYQLVMIAYGENGCTDEFIGYLQINDEFRFYIPNAFTPDNDGINDFFLPKFSYPPNEYEMIIFNRWGETVFKTTDYTQPWTGNIHGGEHYTQDEVYNWVMKTRGELVEVETYTGHVTLIR